MLSKRGGEGEKERLRRWGERERDRGSKSETVKPLVWGERLRDVLDGERD